MDLRSAAVVSMVSFVFGGCATAIDDTGGRSGATASDSGIYGSRWDSNPPPASDTGTTPVDDTGSTVDEDTGSYGYDSGPGYDTAAPERDTYVDPGTGDPCSDCANTKCSSEISACMSDVECSAQMDCLSTCGDSACADACAVAHPSTKVDDMMTCVETRCSVECGGPVLKRVPGERAAPWVSRGI